MQSNKRYTSHASFTQTKRNTYKYKANTAKPIKPACTCSINGDIDHRINDHWMPGQDEIIRDTAKSLINSLPYDDRNPVSKMIIDDIILPRYIADNGLSEFIKTEKDKKELIEHLLDYSTGTNDAYNPGKQAKTNYCPPRICFIETNNKVIIVKLNMDKDDYDYFAKLKYEVIYTVTESNQSGEGYHALVNVKRSQHQIMQFVANTNCEEDETITMSVVTTKEGLIDPDKSKLYINKCYVDQKDNGVNRNNGKIKFDEKFIPDFNDDSKFVELKTLNYPINVRLQDIDYPELAAFSRFLELRDNDCFTNENFYDEVNKMIVSEPAKGKEFYETSAFDEQTMKDIKIISDNGVEAYNYISAKSTGVMSCKTASGLFNMFNNILYHYKCRLFVKHSFDSSITVHLVNYSTIAGLLSVTTRIDTNKCTFETSMKQSKVSMKDNERKDLLKNTWRLSALVTGFMSCNWLGSFPDIKYASVNKKEDVKNKALINSMVNKDNNKLTEILTRYNYNVNVLFV